MAISNRHIANQLRELADRLELAGEKPYRTRAWRTAADTIAQHQTSVEQLVGDGKATTLPGVGKGIAGALEELVATGSFAALDDARSRVPDGLLLLTRVEGVGNASARRIWDTLQVASVEELLAAVVAGRLTEVPRLNAKAQAAIATALPALATTDLDNLPGEMLRDEAQAALAAAAALLEESGDWATQAAGAFVAGAESLTEAELLALARGPESDVVAASALLVGRGWGERSRQSGAGGVVSVRFDSPAATPVTVHFAGRGIDPGIRASIIPAPTEPLGAEKGERRLVELADLRGDLHMHSTWSDGKASILEMARAARERGLTYIAITDHSAPYALVNGLDGDRLRAQAEEIAAAEAEMGGGFRILRGIELEITASAGLGLGDDVLSDLDWVIASIHQAQRQSAAELAKRVAEALDNPNVHCIAHPTSRLIGRREPTALDVDWLIERAAATGTMLEINANPRRLDLSAEHACRAAQAGVGIVINSDAHRIANLDYLEHGVAVARAAGLQPIHIHNTRTVTSLLEPALAGA